MSKVQLVNQLRGEVAAVGVLQKRLVDTLAARASERRAAVEASLVKDEELTRARAAVERLTVANQGFADAFEEMGHDDGDCSSCPSCLQKRVVELEGQLAAANVELLTRPTGLSKSARRNLRKAERKRMMDPQGPPPMYEPVD
jgi:hypothetical protein